MENNAIISKGSRTQKSMKNSLFSILLYICTTLFTFITRTFFIRYLGAEYLGINSLFVNILTMFSVVDLGLDTAIIYSLYNPIAHDDKKKIAALMQYYKKIYKYIALFILAIGISMLPFLKMIITDIEVTYMIYVYYILYLLDTVVSYLLVNRTAIIIANQEIHVIKKYTFYFKLIQCILQISSLIIYKSFIIYLIIQLLCTFMTNLYGAHLANTKYPYIKEKNSLTKQERKKIFQNTKSLLIYKLGGVILNNTDNIFISMLISTTMVGYYSNYSTIILSITNMIMLFFSSLNASVGNLNVTSSKNKMEDIFNKIDFLAEWMAYWCSICLLILCNDFIQIIWGNEYVLPNIILIAAVINFFLITLLKTASIYRETTEIFKYVKNIYLVTAILNIILSYLFASLASTPAMKLFGIIIATACARLISNFWYEPKKTIQILFQKKSSKYFINKVFLFINLLIGLFITYLACKFIKVSLGGFIIKMIICLILPNLWFIIVYYRNKYFIFYKNIILNIFSKIKLKLVK